MRPTIALHDCKTLPKTGCKMACNRKVKFTGADTVQPTGRFDLPNLGAKLRRFSPPPSILSIDPDEFGEGDNRSLEGESRTRKLDLPNLGAKLRRFSPPPSILSIDPDEFGEGDNRSLEGESRTRKPQVVRFLPPPPPPPPPPRFILSRDPNSDDEGESRTRKPQVVRFLPPPPPPPPPRFILSRDPNSDDEGDNRSLEGKIKVVQQPISQSQREGSKVEFTCQCQVQASCEVWYQWLKDDTELQQQNNASLIVDSVKMRDFGSYRCRITSRGDYREVVTSEPAFLEVSPSEGKRLKYLREVDLGTLDAIAIHLENKTPGLGHYRQIAADYGMREHHIRSLVISYQPGKDVLGFLLGSNPTLTVYSFCKKLKEDHLKRFDIVRILEGHLSIEKESK